MADEQLRVSLTRSFGEVASLNSGASFSLTNSGEESSSGIDSSSRSLISGQGGGGGQPPTAGGAQTSRPVAGPSTVTPSDTVNPGHRGAVFEFDSGEGQPGPSTTNSRVGLVDYNNSGECDGQEDEDDDEGYLRFGANEPIIVGGNRRRATVVTPTASELQGLMTGNPKSNIVISNASTTNAIVPSSGTLGGALMTASRVLAATSAVAAAPALANSTAASSSMTRQNSSITGGSLFEEESLEVNTRMPYPEMIYVDQAAPLHGRNVFAMMRHLMAAENMETVRDPQEECVLPRMIRKRVILKNGRPNTTQQNVENQPSKYMADLFTTLVEAQWRWTLLSFSLSFIVSWLLFASIWWLIVYSHGDLDPEHLPDVQTQNNWTPCVWNIRGFMSCFLFSIEVQHTIGFGGRMTSEECPEAIFIMCSQSIVGVMIQAFTVGVIFAKLSRPEKRARTLMFSKRAVICQRDGHLTLQVRVGDMRKSQIIETHVRALVIRKRVTPEGEEIPFEQKEISFGVDSEEDRILFIWPTTLCHKIDEKSPFYEMSASDLLRAKFELVVILEGIVESTSSSIQARTSYLPQEIFWGHRFPSLISFDRMAGTYSVDYSRFHETMAIDTPLCSQKDFEIFQKKPRVPSSTAVGMITRAVTPVTTSAAGDGHHQRHQQAVQQQQLLLQHQMLHQRQRQQQQTLAQMR